MDFCPSVRRPRGKRSFGHLFLGQSQNSNDWIVKRVKSCPFYYGSCQVETDCEGGMRSSDASVVVERSVGGLGRS